MSTATSVPDECQALVTTGPLAIDLESVPVPGELGEGGLGRVLAAGVCGSDLDLLRGGAVAERLWPLVLGHETVVRVESCSPTLTDRWSVGPGDLVFVEEFIPCGWCGVCRRGDYRVCPRTDFRSTSFLRYGRTSLTTGAGLWGGFADYLYLHPNARLHPLPDGLPARTAVLATPVANGLRWVRRSADTRPGECVVVLGPGAHGLGCVAAARRIGAGEVVLVGRSGDEERLQAGLALGATAVLLSDRDDVEAQVRSRTGGRGADVVLDVTGAPEVATLAVRLAARTGRVVFAGGGSGTASQFPVDLVMSRELHLLGVRGHGGDDIAEALGVLADESCDLTAMSSAPTALADGAALLRRLCDPETTHQPPHHVLVPDGPD